MTAPPPPDGAVERELDRHERELRKTYGPLGRRNEGRLDAARSELRALREERDRYLQERDDLRCRMDEWDEDGLREEVERLSRTQAVCHCGSYVKDHGLGDGHSPVDMPEGPCPDNERLNGEVTRLRSRISALEAERDEWIHTGELDQDAMGQLGDRVVALEAALHITEEMDSDCAGAVVDLTARLAAAEASVDELERQRADLEESNAVLRERAMKAEAALEDMGRGIDEGDAAREALHEELSHAEGVIFDAEDALAAGEGEGT